MRKIKVVLIPEVRNPSISFNESANSIANAGKGRILIEFHKNHGKSPKEKKNAIRGLRI
jgi:hypothetical protein